MPTDEEIKQEAAAVLALRKQGVKSKTTAEQIIQQLLRLSEADKRSHNAALFAVDGVLDAALSIPDDVVHKEYANQNALTLLRNLALVPENQVALFNTKGVMEAVFKYAEYSSQYSALNKILIELFEALSQSPENQVPMCKIGVVEKALRYSSKYDMPWTLFANLANSQENGGALFNTLVWAAVDQVVMSFSQENYISPAEKAMEFLGLLASAPEVKVPMFSTKGVVETALIGFQKIDTEKMKESVVLLFKYLAIAQENVIPLFKTPGVVQAALKAINEGGTDRTKESATLLLQSLASAPENAVPLFKIKGVVEAALNGFNEGRNDDIKASAMNIYAGMAVAETPASELAQWPGFVAWVASHTASSAESLRGASTLCLLNMSSWHDSKPYLDRPEVITALSNILAFEEQNPVTRSWAAMTLANLVGMEAGRSSMLTSNVSALAMIQDKLKKAVDTPGREWDLQMPLQALRSLLLAESNRAYYAMHGLPALLTRALALALRTKDARACEFAVGALQQHCFNEDTLVELRMDHTLAEQLAALLGYAPPPDADVWQWETAKYAAQYLKFKLSDMQDTNIAPTPANPKCGMAAKRTIVVSCSWLNKDVGLTVDGFLTDKGMRVWRNFRNVRSARNISVDIVTPTMRAVQGCDAFLCILSKAYHESAHCRIEFEFAKKHNKRILAVLADQDFRLLDSWVGSQLGNVLYYEVMPLASMFQEGMTALVDKELLNVGELSEGVTAPPSAAAPVAAAPVAAVPVAAAPAFAARDAGGGVSTPLTATLPEAGASRASHEDSQVDQSSLVDDESDHSSPEDAELDRSSMERARHDRPSFAREGARPARPPARSTDSGWLGTITALLRAFFTSPDGRSQDGSTADAAALAPRPPLPDSEEEFMAWLERAELRDVGGALLRNGFVTARELAALRGLGVRDVSEALGLSTAAAARIKVELGKFA